MLNKKNILSMLTLSALVLSNSVVAFADETTPIDSSAPIDITQPSTPTEPSTEVPTPVEPSQPVEPTTPTEEPTTPEEPTVPVDPTLPSTEQPKEDAPTQPTEPSTIPETPTNPKEDPKQDIPQPETPTPPKTAEEAANKGESQIGTISTETKQPVDAVTPDKPIVTDTGYTIISTDNSQPVIRYADGSTATVSAESIGAVVNKDKTISVKTADGQTKTLPNTGEAQSLLALLGSLLLSATWFIRKKFI
ncbi:TPA: LPXTG cell wall anchor domain-containing protein [Streptococcus suis]|uniref:LPXTG cell wall anchor domain-containing protein n=1 Tax=Streptococcus suis TaxID=1307 RepID=UPI000CF612B6|nr:LPXTG cell wall anchor domain-containing protein [Streptococcus suis]MCK3868047.1 LPXTG cell wall anchor domain-containing protein [Streptococcus suis]MCQ8267496.1 LPXTG cell wall anchor domain-containing protein [Streptococcus suis]HEL1551252.1 LPXTG cell wall anchor domain-containing protein [Streptococcus suis]HEL2322558.1 LPXTG cell wall anchor domain-containing protein [Streptococcus suis]HEL2324863.1 LPXTG cell wall anchor domain-containing protein [Streptococcus suis]